MRYGNVLQTASHEGRVEMVKFLLEKDANINIQSGKYGCALQAAAWICDKTMVQLLLERGADINMPAARFRMQYAKVTRRW